MELNLDVLKHRTQTIKGTDLKNPTTLGVKIMAQVTYRGVKYDTKDSKSCQKQVSELIYRGIKHTESKTVCAK